MHGSGQGSRMFQVRGHACILVQKTLFFGLYSQNVVYFNQIFNVYHLTVSIGPYKIHWGGKMKLICREIDKIGMGVRTLQRGYVHYILT
jgi:hypothetical protein